MAASVEQAAHQATKEATTEAKTLTTFWKKVTEDWALNFSGMLAYNYLTALAPILLAMLAIGGLVLGTLSPEAYAAFVQSLSSRFPAGEGQTFISSSLKALQHSAGVLLIIAVVTAVFSGSRLFVALDNLFAVIYRVDVRSLIKQNVMAILMMLLFLILAPLSFFAGSIPGLALGFVLPAGAQRNGFVESAEGFVGGLLVAFIMFAAIYSFVPNRKLEWRFVWPGALAASALLNIYEVLFPIYQHLFLSKAGLGSVAGFAVVILIFLYYIGFITLMGAEINAWVSGLRPLNATLPELFQQERLEGIGEASHGAQTSSAGTGGGMALAGAHPGEARQRVISRQLASAQPHQTHPKRDTHKQEHKHETPKRDEHAKQGAGAAPAGGKKRGGAAGLAAAITTVGAMLGAGVALAWRRISQPPLPSM